MVYKRRTIRLKEYDYTQAGMYFVTVCVQDKKCLFGDVENGEMLLNEAGRMIDKWWQKLPDKYDEITIDEYCIMPNHIHGIINNVGAIPCNRPNKECNIPNKENNRPNKKYNYTNYKKGENMVSPVRKNIIPNDYAGLGKYVSWVKRMSTNEYIRNVKNNNWLLFDKRLWQRNYYEHIIQNEKDLYRIREYIMHNPAQWDKDEYYLS